MPTKGYLSPTRKSSCVPCMDHTAASYRTGPNHNTTISSEPHIPTNDQGALYFYFSFPARLTARHHSIATLLALLCRLWTSNTAEGPFVSVPTAVQLAREAQALWECHGKR